MNVCWISLISVLNKKQLHHRYHKWAKIKYDRNFREFSIVSESLWIKIHSHIINSQFTVIYQASLPLKRGGCHEWTTWIKCWSSFSDMKSIIYSACGCFAEYTISSWNVIFFDWYRFDIFCDTITEVRDRGGRIPIVTYNISTQLFDTNNPKFKLTKSIRVFRIMGWGIYSRIRLLMACSTTSIRAWHLRRFLGSGLSNESTSFTYHYIWKNSVESRTIWLQLFLFLFSSSVFVNWSNYFNWKFLFIPTSLQMYQKLKLWNKIPKFNSVILSKTE